MLKNEGVAAFYKVEGEMDKLAMEEAGFFNCVVVPDGAPPSLSSKELPSPDQATLVIRATDGDPPGQALAEELAHRIGKEKLEWFCLD
ncbi:hypothetical protein Fmac_026536 [Flemingia macrophylla]|uniref:Toprim domain-containing protein n=1 Tax=Flemingia macrophylla TaxID=520843 RepID=A0ABD1LFB5_9FABA